MSARYCPDCDRHYPADSQIKHDSALGGYPCPLHPHEKLIYEANAVPDADWKEHVAKVEAERAFVARGYRDADGIYMLTNAPVTAAGGQHWLSISDVQRAIFRSLYPGDLVRSDEAVYEVLGRREATRMYWVRPFSLALSDDDMRRLRKGMGPKRKGRSPRGD